MNPFKVNAAAKTKRKLKEGHVNLIANGGSIGTALLVTIGTVLMKGNCGNFLVSFFYQRFFYHLFTHINSL